MAQSKLEKDIAEMQSVHDDPDTPADVKASLGAALKKAKEQLAEGAGKPSAKKAVTHGSEKKKSDPLADCREIIAKMKKAKQTETTRIEKRKKAGKPAELTVPETVKKAAKVVKTKVEKKTEEGKFVTRDQATSVIGSIASMIANTVKGLKTHADVEWFGKGLKKVLDNFIRDIEEKGYVGIRKEKYEEGGTLEGDGDLTRQVRVGSYRTQGFDYNPQAAAMIRKVLDQENLISNKHALSAAVHDMDAVLQIAKEAKHSGRITEQRFAQAVAHEMRAMFFWYPIDTAVNNGSVSEYWPRFIGEAITDMAIQLRTQKMLLGGMPIIPQANAINVTTNHENMFEAGGVISGQDQEFIEDQLSNNEFDDDEGLIEYFVSEGIPKEVATIAVTKYRSKFIEDPFYRMDWANFGEEYAKGGALRPLVPHDDDYNEWEGEVTRELEDLFNCDTSDAQGIIMVNQDLLDECWEQKLSVKETAAKIKKAQGFGRGGVIGDIKGKKFKTVIASLLKEDNRFEFFSSDQRDHRYSDKGEVAMLKFMGDEHFYILMTMFPETKEEYASIRLDYYSDPWTSEGNHLEYYGVDVNLDKDDINEVVAEIIKEVGEEEALLVKNRESWMENHPDEYARGGRPRSATARDRKYQSGEAWEKNYKRKGSPKHPHYMEDGGSTGGDDIVIIDGIKHKRISTGTAVNPTVNFHTAKTIEGKHSLGTIYKKGKKGYVASGYDWLEFDLSDLKKSDYEKGGSTGSFKKGDKVTFAAEMVEDFEKEFEGQDSRALRQYRKLVLTAVNDIGTVAGVEDELVMIKYDDQWTIPIPPKYLVKLPKMAKGGKISFSDKVKAIEQSLKGHPVPSKYRKEYGKHYDKAEAHEAAKKIAGAMRAREQKMLLGGMPIGSVNQFDITTNHNNLDAHP